MGVYFEKGRILSVMLEQRSIYGLIYRVNKQIDQI